MYLLHPHQSRVKMQLVLLIRSPDVQINEMIPSYNMFIKTLCFSVSQSISDGKVATRQSTIVCTQTVFSLLATRRRPFRNSKQETGFMRQQACLSIQTSGCA